MKSLGQRLVLPSLLLFASSSVFASAGTINNNNDDDNIQKLVQYLLNLGYYLGYNLQVDPTQSQTDSTGMSHLTTPVSETLVDSTSQATKAGGLLTATSQSIFGALLVPYNNTEQYPFFVPNNSTYAPVNNYANSTFNSSAYSSASGNSVSVSALIDQQTYQSDPVSQAVLNILTTYDYSYCLNNDGTALVDQNCNGSQDKIMQSVIGTTPDTQTYFTFDYNQQILSQLNVNSLISPLFYTTTSATPSTSSGSPMPLTSPGLTAQNQAQQAANFIRYVTGAVTPLSLPNRQEYDALFVKAQNKGSPPPYTLLEQFQAKTALASYLTNLRTYAAQTSVGVANLYYILSKRMQQPMLNAAEGQQNPTSQALNEYTMATWRLYNPDQSQNTAWLTQINNASAATMQKEIAVLLAEINYQLYLSRQQQERLLLTNTILLLQNAKEAQPNSQLSSAATAATSTSD